MGLGNIPFAGSEMVQLGIQIEKNGRDFYEALEAKTENLDTKEAFKYLKIAEMQHIEDFQNILDALGDSKREGAYTQEYFDYMRAIAEGCVFAREGEGIKAALSVSNDKDALSIALGFEKESILLYQEMLGVVPEGDKDILKDLIDQERSHVSRLWALKESLE